MHVTENILIYYFFYSPSAENSMMQKHNFYDNKKQQLILFWSLEENKIYLKIRKTIFLSFVFVLWKFI